MGTPSPRYAARFKQKTVELFRKRGQPTQRWRGLGCDAGSLSNRTEKADAADCGADVNRQPLLGQFSLAQPT